MLQVGIFLKILSPEHIQFAFLSCYVFLSLLTLTIIIIARIEHSQEQLKTSFSPLVYKQTEINLLYSFSKLRISKCTPFGERNEKIYNILIVLNFKNIHLIILFLWILLATFCEDFHVNFYYELWYAGNLLNMSFF